MPLYVHLLLLFLSAVAASSDTCTKFYPVHRRIWNDSVIKKMQIERSWRRENDESRILQCLIMAKQVMDPFTQCLVISVGEDGLKHCHIGGISSHPCVPKYLKTSVPAQQTVQVYITAHQASVIANRSSSSSQCMIVQHRVSADVSFQRNWEEYAEGFGDSPDTNWWIGLRNLHEWTSSQSRHLRVEFRNWNGIEFSIDFSNFKVDSEDEKFRLSHMTQFETSDTSLGDCMEYHYGQNFSTWDSDNDAASSYSCSNAFKGGWWYGECHYTNPNGIYYDWPAANATPSYAAGVVWSIPFGHYYSMQEFRIISW